MGATGQKYCCCGPCQGLMSHFSSLPPSRAETRAVGWWFGSCGQRQLWTETVRTKHSGPRLQSKYALSLHSMLVGNGPQTKPQSQGQPPGSLTIAHPPGTFLLSPWRSLGNSHLLDFPGVGLGCCGKPTVTPHSVHVPFGLEALTIATVGSWALSCLVLSSPWPVPGIMVILADHPPGTPSPTTYILNRVIQTSSEESL